MTIYEDIQKTKNRLIKQARSKGMCENFGQKEARKLQDKYGYDAIDNDGYRQALYEFNMWIMEYEG